MPTLSVQGGLGTGGWLWANVRINGDPGAIGDAVVVYGTTAGDTAPTIYSDFDGTKRASITPLDALKYGLTAQYSAAGPSGWAFSAEVSLPTIPTVAAGDLIWFALFVVNPLVGGSPVRAVSGPIPWVG